MKKKLLAALLTATAVLVSTLNLTACDFGTHEHKYTESIVAPTCTEKGYTLHSCTCGDSFKDTETPAAGHNFENGRCTVCQAKAPSEGLLYEPFSDTDEDGNEYDGYMIVGLGDCTDTEIVIPDAYNGKPVIGLYNFAFSDCKEITSVFMPDSIVTIGEEVFLNCTALTSVNIPDSVIAIGESAFANCGITDITVPASLTYFGNYSFAYCTKLTTVNIADGASVIGANAFEGCKMLTSINIPDSVTEIGKGAFTNTAYANDINNRHNETLYIGNHLIEVDETALGSYEIKEGTVNIAGYAFAGSAITSVKIPGSVRAIGEYAFTKCEMLTIISIPDSVTEIGYSAFSNCTELKSVIIGSGATKIASTAFYYCSKLESFSVSAENKEFASQDGILYDKNKTYIISTPDALTGAITIPEGVTYIGEGAFYDCKGLTSITIPDSVTKIGNRAFNGCTRLTSIIIPDSVTEIGRNAFGECNGLKSVTLGNGVTTIGDYAFSIMNGLGRIKSITIPKNVTKIGDYTFQRQYIKDINYEGTIEEWKAIEKSARWKANTLVAFTVHCTDGDLTKAES